MAKPYAELTEEGRSFYNDAMHRDYRAKGQNRMEGASSLLVYLKKEDKRYEEDHPPADGSDALRAARVCFRMR